MWHTSCSQALEQLAGKYLVNPSPLGLSKHCPEKMTGSVFYMTLPSARRVAKGTEATFTLQVLMLKLDSFWNHFFFVWSIKLLLKCCLNLTSVQIVCSSKLTHMQKNKTFSASVNLPTVLHCMTDTWTKPNAKYCLLLAKFYFEFCRATTHSYQLFFLCNYIFFGLSQKIFGKISSSLYCERERFAKRTKQQVVFFSVRQNKERHFGETA